MFSAKIIAGLAALLPATLACEAYTGGVPTAIGTQSNDAVIEIKAGEVYVKLIL